MPVNVLEKIIEVSGKPKEEIMKELDEIFNSLDATLPEEVRKTYAINRLVAMYRKDLSSYSEPFEVIFIGSTGTVDMVSKRRQDALDHYRADPQKAITEGIVDKDGKPLFYASKEEQAKMPDWAKKRLGKLLPEHDYQRLAFGAYKSEGGTDWIELLMRIRGKNCDVFLPTFTHLGLRALKTQASTQTLGRLNDSGQLNIKVIGEMKDDEVISLLKTKFKDKIITLSDFDKWCESHQEFTRLAIIKATVTEIPPITTTTGSSVIRIEDVTMDFIDEKGEVVPPVTCWVPDHVSINFPERAEIWVVGQPTIGERGKSINVLGIYVPTIFKNVVPETKEIEDEEGVKKW